MMHCSSRARRNGKPRDDFATAAWPVTDGTKPSGVRGEANTMGEHRDREVVDVVGEQ